MAYRAKSDKRNEDERLMNLVNDFLDENLYKDNTIDFNRYDDRETQLRGIDVSFNLKNNDYNYKCDEKASVRYINKHLYTFSLELSFINRKNVIQEGWMIDNKEDGNNSYMFIWIDKADSDHPKTINEIHNVEVALLKKNTIVEYLNSLGWTKEKLLKKSMNIRNNTNPETIYMGNIAKDGFKFSFSQQLVEQPINILITREKLCELADFTTKIIK